LHFFQNKSSIWLWKNYLETRIINSMMLGKAGILAVIFILLLVFYLVISWGATGGKKSSMTAEFPSPEIASYLRGVRVLIGLIAIVSLILWFLM